MEKHKIWLSILLVLGVLIPVLFVTPVAAIQENPDQIQSNKTKRPTVDRHITATSVSTRESRFHSTPSSATATLTLESTTVVKSTQVTTLVDTLDPEEAEFQPTLDAIATKDALVQVEKKKNPNGLCGKPVALIPIGLTFLSLRKKRSKIIYL
jgi:hypothetical protein